MLPILISALIATATFAETAPVERKTIELEWDAVPGAAGYEVRLTPAAGGSPLVFRAKDSKLVEEVPVGTYTLEVRSQQEGSDDTFSPWSEPLEFNVVTKNTAPLKPEDGSVIVATDTKNVPVQFEWAPVEGVKEYNIRVWSEARKDNPWAFTTKKTSTVLNIPPGEIYYWQVFFDSADSVTYNQNPPVFNFILQGIKLVRPEITTKVVMGDVKTFTWKHSPGAKEYLAKLSYRHLDETEYQVIREEKIGALQWPTERLRPGQYRLEVQAQSPKRAPSDFSQFEFLIKPSEAELLQALSGQVSAKPQ